MCYILYRIQNFYINLYLIHTENIKFDEHKIDVLK